MNSSLQLLFCFAVSVLLTYQLKFAVAQVSDVAGCIDDLKRRDGGIAVRFSQIQLEAVCRRHEEWLDTVVKLGSRSAETLLTPKQRSFLDNLLNCKDLLCLCKMDASGVCKEAVSRIEGPLDMLRPKNRRRKKPIFSRPLMGGRSGKDEDENPLRRSAGITLDFAPHFRQTKGRRRRRQAEAEAEAELLRPKLNRVTRKEYRQLTEEERARFHAAINAVKRDRIDGMSKYDILIVHHTPEQSPGAHFGPALLPFHRELLKQLELVMRSYDPEVALPYWDSTLDQPLPDPTDSVLWTEDFFGNGKGEVITGPFAHWQTLGDVQLQHLSPNRRIMRDIGASKMGGLYRQSDLEKIRSTVDFDRLTYCVDPYFELVHGTTHMWIGGHMGQLRVSPNDPTFFVFHSFIDFLWEDFRLARQFIKLETRWARERDYPTETDTESCNSFHYGSSRMRPWQLKNEDGLSNRYTDLFYDYEPRPSCSVGRPDACNSPYLFCDTAHGAGRCMSRVSVGGNCSGFEGQPICYRGQCSLGRCKGPPVGEIHLPPPATLKPPVPTTTSRRTTTRRPRPPVRPAPTPTVPRFTATFSIPRHIRTRPPWWLRPITTTSQPHTVPLPSFGRPVPASLSSRTRQTVWFPVTVVSARRGGSIVAFRDATIRSVGQDGSVLMGRLADPAQSPYYTGAAFAQVYSPFSMGGRSQADITVLDERRRPCAGLCFMNQQRRRPWRYNPCVTSVVLDTNPRQSDNIPFTPLFAQARFLNWLNEQKLPDPFVFICHVSSAGRLVTPPWRKQGRDSAIPENGQTPNLRLETVTGAEKTNSVSNNCGNTDRCCSLWASVGECVRNSWMRQACQKSCFVCNAGPNRACRDLDGDCAKWSQRGYCKSNAGWMEENCPVSCATCTRSKLELSRLCGSRRNPNECRDYEVKCPKWAGRGECKKNPWWMSENCPFSCNAC